MKEYDKRKRHISSKLRMIYISSDNVRHLTTKTFTTLHPTTLHFMLFWISQYSVTRNMCYVSHCEIGYTCFCLTDAHSAALTVRVLEWPCPVYGVASFLSVRVRRWAHHSLLDCTFFCVCIFICSWNSRALRMKRYCLLFIPFFSLVPSAAV